MCLLKQCKYVLIHNITNLGKRHNYALIQNINLPILFHFAPKDNISVIQKYICGYIMVLNVIISLGF